MNSNPEAAAPAASSLGLWDAVSIIVGVILGATIYETPPLIFGGVARPEYALAAWVLVGFLSLVGALCYAELGTAYPTSGGDYTYQTRAFGRMAGFVFAWSEMSVIRTGGSIAAMAYVFAAAVKSLPHMDFGPRAGMVYASVAIIGLVLINLAGLKPGKITQNLLTVAKVVGIVGIIVAGAAWFLMGKTPVAQVPPEPPADAWAGFGLAMVFIFYAYGGWNEAAYVAAEVRDRRRDILRALVIGVSLVTLIYLAVNLAYLGALGFEGARSFGKESVPTRVLRLHLGDGGAIAMAILITISALGAINGLLFTGIRLYATFGADHRLFSALARRGRWKVPPGALFVQVFFSLALIALVEYGDYWKRALVAAAGGLNVSLPEAFRPTEGGGKAGEFKDLVTCTAPVFWLFFLMTGLSLLVLRVRDPQRERPFRVPLYPMAPLLFIGSCVYMLYRSTVYALSEKPGEVVIVAAFMLLGLPLYALSGPPAEAKKTVQE